MHTGQKKGNIYEIEYIDMIDKIFPMKKLMKEQLSKLMKKIT